MDFFDNGFACLELLDSKFASDAWKDVDKNEYRTLLETTSESQSPWKSLTSPTTQSFGDFVLEVDKNMYKCWERYGKKHVKPKLVERHLHMFMRTKEVVETLDTHQYIWILVPLISVSQAQGLPILLERSHRDAKPEDIKCCYLVIPPGHALMFDARLRTRIPVEGGGVVFATAYDMTGINPEKIKT